MSDDLKRRLRGAGEYDPLGHDGWEAADRIEELERLTRGQAEQLEIQGNNLAKLSSFGHEQAARIEELERWQSAAFEAHPNIDLDIEASPQARAALAELKGETK